MEPFLLGPVELSVIALESGRPSPGLLNSLADQVDTGALRLVDFVILEKSMAGEVTVTEVDRAEFALAGLELRACGLAGYEDLHRLAELMPAGGTAAVVAFEHVWSRTLDRQLARSGEVVLGSERIPAVVANAILELAAEP